MKLNRSVSTGAALVAALAAGACGSKDATGPAVALSLEEVYTLAREIGNTMSAYTGMSLRNVAGAPVSPLLAARALAAASPFSATSACPLGGTTSVAGNQEGATDIITLGPGQSLTMTANATFAYDGCKTAHFTTSGTVSSAGSATFTQTDVTAHATLSGTLRVSTLDGRSGSCALDLTFDETQLGNAAPVYAASGSACGQKLPTL